MTVGHTCTLLLTVCLLVAACGPGEAETRIVGDGDGIEHRGRVCDVVLEAGERLSIIRSDPSTYEILRAEPERWVEMWQEQASFLSTLEDEVSGPQTGHLAALSAPSANSSRVTAPVRHPTPVSGI